MENAVNELTLLLRCRELPGTEWGGRTDIRLGIQKGKEVIEDVLADVSEVVFSVPLRLKQTQAGPADFFGPFVQGKVGERFIYLCWGERQGPAWEGFRRAKVPLKYLDKKQLSTSLRTGEPVEISIEMTDAKGGPLCATVPEEYIQRLSPQG